MKRLMKKTISIACAVALLFTGIAFVPQTVSADDVWYDMDNTWPEPHPLLEVPEGETSLWTGCTGPDTQIKYTNAFQLEGFKWNTVTPGEAAFFKTIDLKDVACVDNGSGLEKPTAGTYYNMHVKMKYTPPSAAAKPRMMVETSGGIKNIELTKWEFNYSIIHPEENVLEQEIDGVICMAPGADFKFCINYGWLSDSQKWQMKKGILEITEFTLTGDNSWTTAPSNQDVSITDTPWSVRANYNDDPDAGSYGIIQYKVGDNPTDISDTSMRLVSTVGEQEKYPADYPDVEKRNQPVDSADRWWWISATLKNYAETAGLVNYNRKYTGTIKFNSDIATSENCHLYVYVDGDEYEYSLSKGENTLEIPEFTYRANVLDPEDPLGYKDIKFLFDELPEGAIVSVSEIQFTEVNDGWTRVPNADPDFMTGPWNLFGNYIDDPEVTGNYGAIDFKANKANPSNYSDYSFRVASKSGWEQYTVFARLENYCEGILDEGDEYDLTIKLDSSAATVPSEDPKALDKLLIIVGATKYYHELKTGENILTMHGIYDLGQGSEKHNQIMLEMDGLEIGTELTVESIQLSGPNDGWTPVPKNKMTYAGLWGLYAIEDENHWGKLSYRQVVGATGLGSYDIKLRQGTTSPEDPFYGLSAQANLRNYLATATDTKDRPLSNLDGYDIVLEITTGCDKTSVTNYGKVRLDANGQVFDFDLKQGKKTYNLTELCGKQMIYEESELVSKDLMFVLDAVTKDVYLNISKIQFVGDEGEGHDVPNDEAFNPEGTPWTLYALTDALHDKYGAMKYEITGDPAELSSLKMTLKGVSGFLDARSLRATLNSYVQDLTIDKQYVAVIKMKVDESKVRQEDKKGDKKIRVTIDGKDYDFNVVLDKNGMCRLEQTFTFTNTSRHIAFDLDQLWRGSVVSFESVELLDPLETTTTENPTAYTTQNPSDVTTSTTSEGSNVKPKTPGKVVIKKVYKRKKSAKKIKVKLKKVKGAKGYQVAVFKTKKKAKKAKKALKKKNTKKLKVTIKCKKFKNKKKLYVRARAYVLDSTGIKIFGKWSKIKVGKIKK